MNYHTRNACIAASMVFATLASPFTHAADTGPIKDPAWVLTAAPETDGGTNYVYAFLKPKMAATWAITQADYHALTSLDSMSVVQKRGSNAARHRNCLKTASEVYGPIKSQPAAICDSGSTLGICNTWSVETPKKLGIRSGACVALVASMTEVVQATLMINGEASEADLDKAIKALLDGYRR